GDRGQVVRAGGDVVDDRRLAGAGRAPDPARGGGAAGADLPVAAHRLAAQAAAILQVDARHQALAGEVLDDRLRRLAGVGGRGEIALQAPGGRARRGGRARGGLLGPRLGRAAEQPTLAVVDLGLAQDRELLRALDALGDDARADLASERDG